MRRRTPRADARMTLVEHLDELRRRLIVCLVAFLLASILGYILYPRILDFLTHPLDEGGRIGGITVRDLFVPGITTAFTIRIKISVFAGVVFALPVILWQLWRFVTPGLMPREKRYAVPFVVSALGLFALGTWIAFLILPQAIGFLLGFIEGRLKPLIQIGEYLSFVIFMVLAFGLSFQFPLLLVFLAGVGIVTSRRLRSWRRYALFGSFLVGAVATPSQDPYSMALMAAPLYVLYEVSVLVVRFGLKR